MVLTFSSLSRRKHVSRSLTHCVWGPANATATATLQLMAIPDSYPTEVKDPMSSCILVRFVISAPQQELQDSVLA